MGHNETVWLNVKQFAERLSVLGDMLRIVARIGVNIERGIVSLAHASMTRAAESRHVGNYIIIMELGLRILHLPHIRSLRGLRFHLRRCIRYPHLRPRQPVPPQNGSCPCHDARGYPLLSRLPTYCSRH